MTFKKIKWPISPLNNASGHIHRHNFVALVLLDAFR